jgi:hypothetical protein
MKTRLVTVLLILNGAAAWAGESGKVNEDCFTRVLLCGETRSGEITDRDCRLTDGSVGDSWVMSASPGSAVEVTLRSQSTPLRLLLRGDRLDQQTLVPPGQAVAHGTFNFPALSGSFSAAVTSNPAAGNPRGPYSLSAACDIARPCYHTNTLQGCAGYRVGGPPTRFMVEVAFLNPVSGHEGFAATIPAPVKNFAGTYTSFPEPDGIGLFTMLRPVEDHVELRYIHSTDLPFRMGVTDRATGRTAFFSNAENECGDSARDTFAVTDAPVGKCRSYRRGRPDPSVGCFLGNRFQVELTWTDPVTGKSGKGRPHVGGAPYSFGTVGFRNVLDWQVFLHFEDAGDHVSFSFGSFSDWEYTLKVTDTSTGEVRTYHNPAGRLCAVVVPDAFGG